MAIKIPRVTNNAQRKRAVIDYDAVGLYRGNPRKRLARGFSEKAGRNNLGRITIRHRGNGNKRLLRQVDLLQNKYDIPGRVERIEYDPFRSAFIGLVLYRDGERRYLPVVENMKVGSVLISSRKKVDLAPGNRMPLKHIPTGVIISNIELKSGKGACVVRGAGSLATIIAKEGDYARSEEHTSELQS